MALWMDGPGTLPLPRIRRSDLTGPIHDSLLRPDDEEDEPGQGLSWRPGPAPVGYEMLEAACRRLTSGELQEALRHRYLPVSFAPEPEAYVAAGPAALAAARRHDIQIVGNAEPRELVEALQAVYGSDICARAAAHLVQSAPEFSARWRISPGQAVALSAAAGGLAVLWYYLPILAAIVASVVCGIVFLTVCGFRLLGLLPAQPPPRPPRLSDAELPVYTLLVPLFRETRVLDQLVAALCRLDYPALGSKRTN
jgi:hypothetical protein